MKQEASTAPEAQKQEREKAQAHRQQAPQTAAPPQEMQAQKQEAPTQAEAQTITTEQASAEAVRLETTKQGAEKTTRKKSVVLCRLLRLFGRRRNRKFRIACAVAATVFSLCACGAVWLAAAQRAQAVQVYTKAVSVEKPSQTAEAILQTPGKRLEQEPFLMLFNEWNPIPDNYAFTLANVGNTSFQMQPEAAQQLEKLLADGRANGLDLIIRSTYRSHEQQQANFNRKLSTYLAQGLSQATAEEYTRASIATPGRSEHETGLAADIANSGGRVLGPWFAETAEYAWLLAHCTEYGFIQRYPENRQDVTGVYYEPWHYRYVGVEYAGKIAASGLTFEEYLAAAGVEIAS